MRHPLFIVTVTFIVCAAILAGWVFYLGPTVKVWRLEDEARAGDAEATFELYRHYLEYRNDINESNKWLKHGAELGDRRLQYMYASVLTSDGAVSDAFCWFSRAARQGDPKSWLRLAEQASETPGAVVPKKELFELAAHAGSVTGAVRFAREVISGADNDDSQVAYMLLQRAVDRTHPDSIRRKEINELLPKFEARIGDESAGKYLNVVDRASPSTQVEQYLENLCS